MAILGFELEELARLIALVETGDLDEIVLEEEGRRLRIRGPRSLQKKAVQAVGTALPTYLPAPLLRKPAAPPEPPSPAEDTVPLVSPMVGVFYRAGKPGDPPLVEVGQRVTKDQPIGLIEAMKIFSEILAEQGGFIVAIPGKDGELVQAGTPLVILKLE